MSLNNRQQKVLTKLFAAESDGAEFVGNEGVD